ncbi:hypothetical protein HMPREF3192_00746 [Atopobium deltae]|uniref:Uncharacterized protein n=1 Tax=Atopobium deltae TaxID=1393034 RepID=A0A133XUP7_9ACTN|nr:hypothetical protein HMPREF3192_00746 [Atopobium deltae]
MAVDAGQRPFFHAHNFSHILVTFSDFIFSAIDYSLFRKIL